MKVTQDDIINFNNLYLQYKTYAAVARETGFSASTIKKYIIKNYTPAEKKEVKRFSGELPEVDYTIFRAKDWAPLLNLNEAEEKEIEEFWEELVL